MLNVFSFASAGCYVLASWLQWRCIQDTRSDLTKPIMLLGLSAFSLHAITLVFTLHHANGVDLGFFSMASLISWVIAALVIGSSFRQRVHNLYPAIFPMAATTVLLATLLPASHHIKSYEGGLFVHILFSVLGLGIFTLAAFQAFLIKRQHSALKQHPIRGVIANLPSLQVMENLLFQMLWVGFILLTISLISGWIFIDNLFEQKLAHKTFFSLCAWIMYAILLSGRQLFGWRSLTAIRWTLGGFSFLVVGYFGSKLVLEFILN